MLIFFVTASKGLVAIILTQLCDLISLAFTIVFSLVLIAFVNWNALLNCKDELSCTSLQYLQLTSPFDNNPPSLFGFMVMIYFIVFASIWIFQCYSTYKLIYEAIVMQTFFRKNLVTKLCQLSFLF